MGVAFCDPVPHLVQNLIDLDGICGYASLAFPGALVLNPCEVAHGRRSFALDCVGDYLVRTLGLEGNLVVIGGGFGMMPSEGLAPM